jgi:hypothetical protein
VYPWRMAIQEHENLLALGVTVWNKWRISNPEIEPDLGMSSLTARDLVGANFSRTDLRGADLSFANLSGANLGRSLLDRSNVRGTDLSEVNLKGAKVGNVLQDSSTRWPRGFTPPREAPSHPERPNSKQLPDQRAANFRLSRRLGALDEGTIHLTSMDLESLLREAEILLEAQPTKERGIEWSNLLQANVATVANQLRGPDPDPIIVERAVARVIGLIAPSIEDVDEVATALEAMGFEFDSARATAASIDRVIKLSTNLGSVDETTDLDVVNSVVDALNEIESSARLSPHNSDLAPIDSLSSSARGLRIREARLQGLERFYNEILPNQAGKLVMAVAGGVGAATAALAGRSGAIIQAIRALIRFFA